jgi:hypothetical protein
MERDANAICHCVRNISVNAPLNFRGVVEFNCTISLTSVDWLYL